MEGKACVLFVWGWVGRRCLCFWVARGAAVGLLQAHHACCNASAQLMCMPATTPALLHTLAYSACCATSHTPSAADPLCPDAGMAAAAAEVDFDDEDEDEDFSMGDDSGSDSGSDDADSSDAEMIAEDNIPAAAFGKKKGKRGERGGLGQTESAAAVCWCGWLLPSGCVLPVEARCAGCARRQAP